MSQCTTVKRFGHTVHPSLLKIDILHLLAPAEQTSSVKLCLSLTSPHLTCQLSSASIPLFYNYTLCMKSQGARGGLYSNVCACVCRKNMQIASPSSSATTDYSPWAMQIQVHSASLHCTDTVKWFRPGSHEQLYFNPEVGIQTGWSCVFVSTRNRHVGVL